MFDVLASTDAADAAFAELIGKLLTSPEQADGLVNFAVDQVALSFGSGAAHAAAQTSLDQNPSLERAGETDIGALWRARPDGVEPARIYIDDQGTLTPVPSGLVGGSIKLDDFEFEPGSVLVLSERADENWRATIDADTLEPVEWLASSLQTGGHHRNRKDRLAKTTGCHCAGSRARFPLPESHRRSCATEIATMTPKWSVRTCPPDRAAIGVLAIAAGVVGASGSSLTWAGRNKPVEQNVVLPTRF